MNIAVAQSGGPTAAINSSLAGVIAEAMKISQVEHIYGAKNGIAGVMNDEFCDLRALVARPYGMVTLRQTPSSALGSCRIKLTEEDYPKIIANLVKRNIGAFFYIGGNDSMDTVSKLHDYVVSKGINIRFVGIPKTIDNDLPETDHTPGFGSAAKYLAATVKEIIADSNVYYVNSVTIIEVMGRDAGWLTASTSILRETCGGMPHLIYLPERPFDVQTFLKDVANLHESGIRAVIVAVSEGLKDADGEYVAADNQSGKADVFGHKYLAGLGKFLEAQVSDKLVCKVRSIELNVMQRCASHIASMTDLDEAAEVAAAGVRAAVTEGYSGVMMSIVRVSDAPYKVEYLPVDVKCVANHVRHFPAEWINTQGNGINEQARGYFMPLIQGEPNVLFEDGVPVHFKVDETDYMRDNGGD
ncbi:MAG: 6-phosphofructokinase [Oscillospiraceae bacterium]|nr:6-phosphofructokinase [Oscillospiraceae bacterium]